MKPLGCLRANQNIFHDGFRAEFGIGYSGAKIFQTGVSQPEMAFLKHRHSGFSDAAFQRDCCTQTTPALFEAGERQFLAAFINRAGQHIIRPQCIQGIFKPLVCPFEIARRLRLARLRNSEMRRHQTRAERIGVRFH
jgi:hypothetical protein